MRRIIVGVLAPMLVLACKPGDRQSEASNCDAAALTKLAESLAAASPAEQARMVWSSLDAACGEALPKPVRDYFGKLQDPTQPAPVADESLATELEKVCPGSRETQKALADAPADQRATAVHRGCNIDRFGVFEGADAIAATSVALTPDGGLPVVAFVAHQRLLEQGIDPAQARTITRALYALEARGHSPVRPLAGQTWPTARGFQLEDGLPIHVSASELVLEGQTLANLEHGLLAEADVKDEVVPKLLEILQERAEQAKSDADTRGEEWPSRLIIAADADTPAATIVALITTAGRAGFERFSYAVEPGVYGYAQVPTSLATVTPVITELTDSVWPVDSLVTIELDSKGASLARGRYRGVRPVEVPRGDDAAVLTYAQEAREENSETRLAAISVAPDVPLRELVAIIAAVRGPECSAATDEGCVLPDVVVLARDAHRHNPKELKTRGAYAIVDDDDKDPFDSWDALSLASKAPRDQVKVKVEVEGALDEERALSAAEFRHLALHACYSVALQDDPNLSGTVTINLEVRSTGFPGSSIIEENTASDDVGNCLAKAVRTLMLPGPDDGKSAHIIFTFELSPKK